jgi:CheY-like chemotaxis protein
MVEAHGGSATVDSDGRGRGATFTIRLPAGTAAADLPAAAESTLPGVEGGRRILLVDDNRDAAELLADSLRAIGHIVEVAYDGPGALAVMERFQPEVGLLDLGLPVMDGLELALRMRQAPSTTPLILVAVTGYAQEADRQRTREAGFDAHLAKPIDVHALDELLRQAELNDT